MARKSEGRGWIQIQAGMHVDRISIVYAHRLARGLKPVGFRVAADSF